MVVIHHPNGKPQAAAAIDNQQFTVVAWRDPVVELLPDAVPTCSDEALVWWTPSVGPTGMLMAHRFAAYAGEGPTMWTAAEVAATFGMSGGSSRLLRTLGRLERFGIIACQDGTIAVRLMLAPLTRRQRAQLPEYLAEALDNGSTGIQAR